MAPKVKEYQRLPGVGPRKTGLVAVSATRSRLWLGNDHLLAVDSTGYTEEYKRFYFRDIQMVSFHQTRRGRVTNLIFGAIGVLFCVFALAQSGGLAAFLWVIAGLFLTVVLANSIAGPTCAAHLKTAVQTEELPSLRRVWQTRKIFKRLRPLIAAAQGELTPEEIAARYGASAAVEPAQPESAVTDEERYGPPAGSEPPVSGSAAPGTAGTADPPAPDPTSQ